MAMHTTVTEEQHSTDDIEDTRQQMLDAGMDHEFIEAYIKAGDAIKSMLQALRKEHPLITLASTHVLLSTHEPGKQVSTGLSVHDSEDHASEFACAVNRGTSKPFHAVIRSASTLVAACAEIYDAYQKECERVGPGAITELDRARTEYLASLTGFATKISNAVGPDTVHLLMDALSAMRPDIHKDLVSQQGPLH